MIPTSIIRSFSILTKREIIVLSYLYACRNRRTGQCNPRQKQIADMTGLWKTHVSSAIKSLGEKGLIEVDMDGNFLLISDTESYQNGNSVVTKTVTRSYQNGNKSYQNGNLYIKDLNREVTEKEQRQKNAEIRTPEARPKLNHIPINPSLDLELNIWLDAVAVAVGAKDSLSLPKRKKWEAVCISALREQRDLGKFLKAIENEKTRTKDTPQFFSPDTVLQTLQLNGSTSKQSKWMHDV